MSTNLQLVNECGPNRQELARLELASAIEAATLAERAGEASLGAVERAKSLLSRAQTKLEEARAEAATAKQAKTASLIEAAASGAALKPDRSARDARIKEADAEDEIEAAETALATLEASVVEHEVALSRARRRVTAAAENIIKSGSLAHLFEAAKKVQEDLIARRAVLRFLISADLVSADEKPDLVRFMRLNAEVLPGTVGSTEFSDFDSHPAVDPWRQCLEALKSDAAAPLPA